MSEATVDQTAFIVVRRFRCPSGRRVLKYARDGVGWTEQRKFAWTSMNRVSAEQKAKSMDRKCHVEECFVNSKPLAKFGDPMEPLVLGRARKGKSK